jgi:hypothetical protein
MMTEDKKRRLIELGYVKGRILRNGKAVIDKPKGIQHWYSTRELKNKVEERLEIFPDGMRINGEHLLQIRGKHMRRLKKKMKIKQVGRYIVRTK